MNSETQALIKRDSSIPGLATLLDESAFTDVLQSYFPAAKMDRAKLVSIRYKPGTNCLASFEMRINTEKVMISAKTFNKDAREKIEKNQIKKAVDGLLGPGRVLLEDLNLLISFFPNDSKLRVLPKLFQSAKRREILAKVLPNRRDLWDGTIKTLKYKPERRYVLALEGQGGGKAVLKLHHPDRFKSAQSNATSIRSQKKLHIPQCLGFSETYSLIASEWVDGENLQETIRGDIKQAIAVVAHVGEALAELHTLTSSGLRLPSHAYDSTLLSSMAKMIESLAPRFAKHSEQIATRLIRTLSSAPKIARPIHGDFYSDQVLHSNNGLYLLDFDQAMLGNPATDLGCFLAHLELDILQDKMDTTLALSLKEALLTRYSACTGKPVSDGFAWQTAKHLFLLAQHPFRNNAQYWDMQMEAILDRIDHLIIEAAHTNQRLQVGVPFPPRANPEKGEGVQIHSNTDLKMSFISKALDPEYILPRLQRLPVFRSLEKDTLQVKNCRLVRYKPGRRCLIEYDVEMKESDGGCKRQTLMGKISAKGREEEHYLLNKHLWNACFKKINPREIAIPEPLGIIAELQMWMQQKVNGVNATVLLSPGSIGLTGRIGTALFNLHHLNVDSKRSHTMLDELRILNDRLERVKEMMPASTNRLNRILDACHKIGTALPPSKFRGIHRDFYADQVIVAGPFTYLIDFDLYCMGDPALDIGNFLGHLTEQALRCFNDPYALADCEAALENQYLDHASDVSPASIQTYKTLTLARHIYISTQFDDRQAFSARLLELCEERLHLSARV